MEPRSTITYAYETAGFSRLGDGWEKKEILQNIRHPATYTQFSGETDIEAFVEEVCVLSEDDLTMLHEEQQNADWYKCHRCEDEIDRLEKRGDEQAAAAIDPAYTVTVTEEVRDLEYGGNAETRIERTFEAYCARHRSDGAVFTYTDSWLE